METAIVILKGTAEQRFDAEVPPNRCKSLPVCQSQQKLSLANPGAQAFFMGGSRRANPALGVVHERPLRSFSSIFKAMACIEEKECTLRPDWGMFTAG